MFFPLLPIFRAWWTGAKWAVFPSFPAERTSLFHPWLTGFLFSSPPSNVRALKSAANQSFMVFWGQFDIHALLFSVQQLQGDCPKKKKKKKWATLSSLSPSFSLDEYGLWRCNGTEDMASKYNSGEFCWAAEIVKRQGEWQGTKKDYRVQLLFMSGPLPRLSPFSQMKFLCSFNGILSHLDWFTFIAFIAQIRGKWRGRGGWAASLLKRN